MVVRGSDYHRQGKIKDPIIIEPRRAYLTAAEVSAVKRHAIQYNLKLEQKNGAKTWSNAMKTKSLGYFLPQKIDGLIKRYQNPTRIYAELDLGQFSISSTEKMMKKNIIRSVVGPNEALFPEASKLCFDIYPQLVWQQQQKKL